MDNYKLHPEEALKNLVRLIAMDEDTEVAYIIICIYTEWLTGQYEEKSDATKDSFLNSAFEYLSQTH
jgi:hypothetical protein